MIWESEDLPEDRFSLLGTGDEQHTPAVKMGNPGSKLVLIQDFFLA